MSESASMPNGDAAGMRGRVAVALANSIDKIPNVERSKSLMFSTLYPGGRIGGVVLSAELVTVHITVDQSRYGDDLRSIGKAVVSAAEKALRSLGDVRPVAVRIDDFLSVPVSEPDTDR